jgi:flavin-dependent dehydrogenase
VTPVTSKVAISADPEGAFDIKTPQYDVVIMGGGLAGLSLAIQLRQNQSGLRILILERSAQPAPMAAHKIGESSVEIGAHYFDHVLGLKTHLDEHQLKKFGFRFFFSDQADDITQVTELGASKVLATPSYQIDRGSFENFLTEHVRSFNVEVIKGATVRRFDLALESRPHQIVYTLGEKEYQVSGSWLIDAGGRSGLIKRKLNLQESNPHDCNAAWFRIKDRIDINAWAPDNREWLARCTPPNRWLSTNHLCGPGYWVWLIPLSSGSHSVGIVADSKMHSLESFNTFEKAMRWLSVHQPQLFRELEGREELLQDFAFFKNYSYSCTKLYDGSGRWALTGDAGVFLDPFYSPGSDFIAIGNTFITALIGLDQAGSALDFHAKIYEQIHFSLYQNVLSLYQDQYVLFGDPEVLPNKIIWDYTYYWGVMCPLFFQNRLTDVFAMSRIQERLIAVQNLNLQIQEFFRAWNLVSKRHNPAQMLDQASLDWFAKLNQQLKESLSPAQFDARLTENLHLLDELARQIIARAHEDYPNLDASKVEAAIRSTSHRTTTIQNASYQSMPGGETSLLFEKAEIKAFEATAYSL